MYGGNVIGEHKFNIQVNTALSQGRRMKIHHGKRLDAYIRERSELQGKLRSTAEIVEYDHSGGRGQQFVVDQEVSKRLSIVMERIKHHEKRLRFFAAFVKGAEIDGEIEFFQMTTEDMIYFGFVDEYGDDNADAD